MHLVTAIQIQVIRENVQCTIKSNGQFVLGITDLKLDGCILPFFTHRHLSSLPDLTSQGRRSV